MTCGRLMEASFMQLNVGRKYESFTEGLAWPYMTGAVTQRNTFLGQRTCVCMSVGGFACSWWFIVGAAVSGLDTVWSSLLL